MYFPARLQCYKSGSSSGCAGATPTLRVAVLEAGGGALLSPPNWPHVVVTLQDCVMVETRKVFRNVLDEVGYFVERAALWREPPILYPFITALQAGEAAAARRREVAAHLRAMLEGSAEEAGEEVRTCLRSRAEASLEVRLTLCSGGARATAQLPDRPCHTREQHHVSTIRGAVAGIDNEAAACCITSYRMKHA